MRRKSSSFESLAIAALVILSAAICAGAQTANAVKRNIREHAQTLPAAAAAATQDKNESGTTRFVYEFRQPEFIVSFIRIEHDAGGRGQISFARRGDAEPLVEPLELSPAALERIAAAWNALGFLDSELNYQAARQYPHLGTMRLGMTQGKRERTVEFNWSDDPHASALANEYRRAADQSMFVFEINLARDLQPLEAPKLLNRLESLISRDALSDSRQLIALLRNISTDERFPLIARNQAGRILKKLEK